MGTFITLQDDWDGGVDNFLSSAIREAHAGFTVERFLEDVSLPQTDHALATEKSEGDPFCFLHSFCYMNVVLYKIK